MISSGTRKTDSATAPGQSTRWSLRVCGICRTLVTTTKARAPSGMLTRKIQRQPSMPAMESTPENTPPTTGPMTEEAPKTPMKYAWYLLRSRGGTRSPRMVNASDSSPPAPSPWTARAAARPYIEVAKAHSAEPRTNRTMAVR